MARESRFLLLLVLVTLVNADAARRMRVVVTDRSGAAESTTLRPRPSGDPATNPPPWNEQHKYVTPTPLPYKPDWSVDEWVEYFKGRHPNFWFKEQLGKKKKKKRRKADEDSSVSV